ncbi:right-handed parallel beta-helix repeat-containing protein [Agarivorans sp. QJM3NY_25]|uniref:right-handed parallel beta-helix repeat-containing protein n=1 Tax=Agarivorans sp. QJM3NY_25 TaxID=3421430 RepID=UPI003D7EFFAC
MKLSTVVVCVSSAFTLNALNAYAASADDLVWQAITFGQSTDLNFGSTILPEKVGTNQVTVNGQPVQPGPVANQFTIESRGGKIANSHEGMTFYYTKLPTDVNFSLSATITLEQLGPETGSKPNRQEGAGIMLRDVIGKPRLDPQPEGLEEFPAASNMVAAILRANKKANNGLININATYREGIYQPWGTGGNRMKRDEFIKGVPYGPAQTYQIGLTRTNTGYSVSYRHGELEQIQAVKGANANVVEMQDPAHQYLGFFASRNAKVTVSKVKLQLSKANTADAPRFVAKMETPIVQAMSPEVSATNHYTVQAQANYSGQFSLSQDGQSLVENQHVAAGEMFSYPTQLAQSNTKFDLSFTPLEGPDTSAIQTQYKVVKQALKNPMQILVNPQGDNGRLSLADAIQLVPPGGTILLEDGDYPGLEIPISASGTPDHMKTLKAKGNKVRITDAYLHDASYWNISGLEVIGARTNVHGSHNNFAHMVTHQSPDTGFQISSAKGIGRALWASYNVVSDSISFNNMDDSQINADGFAAKIRVGDGNTFIRCISHHNIDDGWDLFNKVEDGSNGAVTIIDSISYMNGQTLTVKGKGGTRGNGFKLGGEGLPVAHVVKNSIAFHNNMDGFTDNFNPGSLILENNVAIDNARFNFLFRKSPYSDAVKQGDFTDNQSYRFFVKSKYSDVVNASTLNGNQFIIDGKATDQNGNLVDISQLDELKAASKVNTQDKVPGDAQAKKLQQLLK